MRLSAFGDKFAASSGISSLMDDLGRALEENPALLFMGGGNPGRVEAAEVFFQQRIEAVLADPARRHQLFGVYQSPQGDRALRQLYFGLIILMKAMRRFTRLVLV